MSNGVTTEAPSAGAARVGASGAVGGGAGALMVMLNVPVVDWPPESATRSAKVNVPAVVGVPVIRPGEAWSARPGGSVPLIRVHVYGVLPPSANTPTA